MNVSCLLDILMHSPSLLRLFDEVLMSAQRFKSTADTRAGKTADSSTAAPAKLMPLRDADAILQIDVQLDVKMPALAIVKKEKAKDVPLFLKGWSVGGAIRGWQRQESTQTSCRPIKRLDPRSDRRPWGELTRLC